MLASCAPLITATRSISSAAGSGRGGAVFLNFKAASEPAIPATTEAPMTRPSSLARMRTMGTPPG